MTPEDLVEVEAIKRLKYRYVRAVDLKQWDELADTLTPDAEAAYSGGKLSFTGRDAIVGFMRDSLTDPDTITSHRVHHPEITLTGPTTATATWALDDVVISVSGQITIRGSAYYRDEMVKVDGAWRIRRTGYRRIYEEMESRDRPGLTLTDTWWTEAAAMGEKAAAGQKGDS
jgi:uncharacterized protein (TIGR02246 family)